MDEFLTELYHALKGSRMVNGQLTIKGASNEQYEDLLMVIVEAIQPYIEGDYYDWLERQAVLFRRYRLRQNYNSELYEPFLGKDMTLLSVREQLVLLKHWLYKYTYQKRPRRRDDSK